MGTAVRCASVRVFWLPKDGNSLAEYEDAFWPRDAEICESTSAPLRLAVADGATETSFSGLWARLLVASYGRGRTTGEDGGGDLKRIRRVWRKAVGQKPLAWYAEEKLRSGAFSSILGLTLSPPESAEAAGGPWQAWAIGDSCLIQVRRGQLAVSFPLADAAEFDSRPALIASLDTDDAWETGSRSLSGRWRPGDAFFLLTDALAAWCLQQRELGGMVFERLSSLQTGEDFVAFVAEARSTPGPGDRPALKNDDLTLVRCLIE